MRDRSGSANRYFRESDAALRRLGRCRARSNIRFLTPPRAALSIATENAGVFPVSELPKPQLLKIPLISCVFRRVGQRAAHPLSGAERQRSADAHPPP
jgi:hypothetical protein